MSIESTRNEISAVNSKLSSLKSDLKRLQDAKADMDDFTATVKKYRSNVNEHKESIDSFASFSWEGETVGDFKNLYNDAIGDFDMDIIVECVRISDSLDDRILQAQSAVSNNETQLRALNYELRRLLAAQ